MGFKPHSLFTRYTGMNKEEIDLLPPLWLRGAMRDCGLTLVNSVAATHNSEVLKGNYSVFRLHSIPTSKQLNNLRVRLTNRGFSVHCRTNRLNYPVELRCKGWILTTGSNRLESPANYCIDHIKLERKGRNQKNKVRREDSL